METANLRVANLEYANSEIAKRELRSTELQTSPRGSKRDLLVMRHQKLQILVVARSGYVLS